MGSILLLKEADFSQNAVPAEDIYDVVKETDFESATPHYPMINKLKYYNSIPLAKKVKIYGVKFVLQESAASVDLAIESNIAVGATNLVNGVLRSVTTDISDIAAAFKAGTIEGGSAHTVMLSSPITINAGEYVMFGHASGNRLVTYSRNNDSGHGYMTSIDEPVPPSQLNYYPDFAATFYGVELD